MSGPHKFCLWDVILVLWMSPPVHGCPALGTLMVWLPPVPTPAGVSLPALLGVG